MSAKKKVPAKKAPKVTPKPEPEAPKSNLKPSWLVARLRNALHKSRKELKEGKTLKGVSTLSDIKAALGMGTVEWEALLENFFNLGGKLEK